MNAECFDRIAVSTNDPEIPHQDEKYIRIEQPYFEQTYNVMLQVVRHADDELYKHHGFDADAICLLQPTSPLRTAQDVANCVQALREGRGLESVVSVTEAENDVAFQVRFANRLERLPTVVRPNGAVYVIRTSLLRSGGTWYGDYAYAYHMPKERSIDIDNELDLEMARLAWDRLYGNSCG